MQEAPMLKVRGEDIKQTSFRRLRDGEWLNDETINPFLLKYVHDAVPLTHCYSTHFFTRLRPPGGDYCYSNVTRWSRRIRTQIDDGWQGLRVLYVPINIGNMHWVFIRVDMSRKRVELYDSQGYCKPGNKQYLIDMTRYLYDELIRDLPQSSRPTFESWRRHWRAVDKSREAPKQGLWSVHVADRISQLQRRSNLSTDVRPTLRGCTKAKEKHRLSAHS